MLPQKLFDKMDAEHDLTGVVIKDFKELDPKKQLYQMHGMLFVPGHAHDLSESNVETLCTYNLRVQAKSSLLGGAFCKFYVKKDAAKAAYICFCRDNKYYYYKWA